MSNVDKRHRGRHYSQDPVYLTSVTSTNKTKTMHFHVDDSLIMRKGAKDVLLSVRDGIIHPNDPVSLKTTGPLPDHKIIYGETNNDPITIHGTKTGTLKIDDTIPQEQSRILVSNQEAPEVNGIYIVSVVGNISKSWKLTRDQNTVSSGAYYFVESGETNAGSGWVLITPNPITYDKEQSIVYKKFTGITAKAFKSLSIGNGMSLFNAADNGIRGIESIHPGIQLSSRSGNNVTLNMDEGKINISKLNGYNPNFNFEINDSIISQNSVWSSQRVHEIIESKTDQVHTHHISDINDIDKYLNRTIGVELKSRGIAPVSKLTDLSDCYDSGSGKIITNSERFKLQNIEDNATTDQTPKEIKFSYESNNNTNCFTDKYLDIMQSLEKMNIRELQSSNMTPEKIKLLYEQNKNIISFTKNLHDGLHRLLENENTGFNPARIKKAYETNNDTNCLTDTHLSVLENTSGKNTGDEIPANESTRGVVRLASDNEISGCNGNGVVTSAQLKFGKPNGVATLTGDGKLHERQIPAFSHSFLSDKSFDDHPQYLHVNGRKKSQIIHGGSDPGGILTIKSSKTTTPGYVYFPEQVQSKGIGMGSVVIDGGISIAMNCSVGGKLQTFGGLNVEGDMIINGKLNGINFADLVSDLSGSSVIGRLKNLDVAEICQIENINNTNISPSTWSQIGTINQDLNTKSAVEFVSIRGRVLDSYQPAIDHSSLANLTEDCHSQYVLNQGRGSGQMVYGGTVPGASLHFRATTDSRAGGMVSVDDQTEATAATNGAFHVKGGASVKGNIFCGNDMHARKYHGFYSNSDVRTDRQNQVPAGIWCYELNGGPNVHSDFTLTSPRDPISGQTIMIYNNTNYNATGDFDLPKHMGSMFFYNGSQWRRC